MMDDRSVCVFIAGQSYPLCLTLRATKDITARFGGLEHLGEALGGQDIGQQLDTLIWLLGVLLREGGKRAQVLGEPSPPPPAPEALESLLTLGELNSMRDQLFLALAQGMRREVPDSKNQQTGQAMTAESLPG